MTGHASTSRAADDFLRTEIGWYWPRRNQDPGMRYQTTVLLSALRRLRTTGPWWNEEPRDA